jgi:probable F420-dependent oxidoreductase
MPAPPLALPPIGTWTGSLRSVPIGEARDLAAELEALGYGAMWFPESDGRDVFVLLALLLSATERLLGGTAVATIHARDAIAMTSAAKALTEAFPERVLVGLGVSHRPLVETMRGHTYERPLATMRRYLDAMDAASYSAVEPPTPVRRLLAALGPRMLALAADRTDGVIPYLVPPEHTAVARAAVGDERSVCTVQAVVLEADRDRALDVGRRCHTAFYMHLPNYTTNLLRLGFTEADLADGGSDRLVDGVVAWGSPARILRRIQEHFDAGADHVCVQVIADGPVTPPVAVWRELAPALREIAAVRTGRGR